MKHFNRITAFMLSAALAASLSIAPASAMSYSVEGADGGFFGPITSIDSELEPADSASDYSKNAAYAPRASAPRSPTFPTVLNSSSI